MNTFFCEEIKEPISVLDTKESTHCIRVLRHKLGDKVKLMDGKGRFAVGNIIRDVKTRVEIDIEHIENIKRSESLLHIAIAPTKSNDRIEWFLEKATELDVAQITFLTTDNSERRKINIDRFEKIVLSAAKQSKSAYLPKLNSLTSYSSFLEIIKEKKDKFIATLVAPDEDRFSNIFETNGEKVVLVGPEGGFSKKELKLAQEESLQPILLGNKRLRTETAGVYISAIHYFKNK